MSLIWLYAFIFVIKYYYNSGTDEICPVCLCYVADVMTSTLSIESELNNRLKQCCGSVGNTIQDVLRVRKQDAKEETKNCSTFRRIDVKFVLYRYRPCLRLFRMLEE